MMIPQVQSVPISATLVTHMKTWSGTRQLSKTPTSMRAAEAVMAVAGRCDDQVDDVRSAGNADPVKDEDERADPRLELSPGDQRHDHDQRADIEDQDAVDDAVGGRGQDNL